MGAIIDYAQVVPASITGTSEAAGYDFENVLDPRILKPWRSTSAASQSVDFDLGSAKTVESVWVSTFNFADIVLYWSDDAFVHVTVADTATSVPTDVLGRRRIRLAGGSSHRYWRIWTWTSSPDDGGSYFTIGSVFLFGTTATLPTCPEYGWQQEQVYPQVAADLPNGRRAVASTGPAHIRLSLELQEWRGQEDASLLIRQARTGVVGLDLGLAAQPELAWPVTAVEPQYGQRMEAIYAPLTVDLREVV